MDLLPRSPLRQVRQARRRPVAGMVPDLSRTRAQEVLGPRLKAGPHQLIRMLAGPSLSRDASAERSRARPAHTSAWEIEGLMEP